MFDRPVKLAIAVAAGVLLGMIVAIPAWPQAPADALPQGRIEQGRGIVCNEAAQIIEIIRSAHDAETANAEVGEVNKKAGRVVCAPGEFAFVKAQKIGEERDALGHAFDVLRIVIVAIKANGAWMPLPVPLVAHTGIMVDRPVEKKV